LGVFAGLALATKESALGIFLGMALVLLARHWQQHRDWSSWNFWAIPAIGVFACAVSLGLGSGLFVDPGRYFAHLEYLAGNLEMARSGALIIEGGFPYSWEGHIGFIVRMYHYIVDIMTLPGFLLAIVGVGWATWKEKKGALAFLAIAYVLYMFLLARSSQMRYLMPAAFLLSFYASRAVIVAWESRWPLMRGGFAALACGIITVSLLRGIALTYEMIKDSRFAAGEWLEAQTQVGDRVEYFGPVGKLPPLKAGVVTGQATDYLGIFVRTPVDAAKVEEIRRGWQERKPEFVITMADLSSPSGVPHNISLPPEVYAGLMGGTMGYRLAAQFKTPPLFPWLPKPALDYPTVNPVIRVFVRREDSAREADSPPASLILLTERALRWRR
jgi:hypothetical protein